MTEAPVEAAQDQILSLEEIDQIPQARTYRHLLSLVKNSQGQPIQVAKDFAEIYDKVLAAVDVYPLNSPGPG